MMKIYILLLLIFNLPFIYAEDKAKGGSKSPVSLSSEVFSPPIAVNLKTAPKVDGSGDDAEWKDVPEYSLTVHGKDGEVKNVKIKSCRSGGMFFMLINYPEEAIVRKHKPWCWDEKKKIYVSGNQRENTLTLLFLKDADHTTSGDAWIWRAARTDIAGYADDMVFFGKNYQMDKGQNCWFSKFFGEFIGTELPRFYQRKPRGSAGDVKAKGKLDKKTVTIEFARKLQTGHSDDFILNRKLFMKLIIQPGK
jgi:hypothetical protein